MCLSVQFRVELVESLSSSYMFVHACLEFSMTLSYLTVKWLTSEDTEIYGFNSNLLYNLMRMFLRKILHVHKLYSTALAKGHILAGG